jgi:SOS-response transcriptional repressor LexA
MAVGKRLKALMERRGVTQKEVAQRTGMSAGAVNLIVNEKRKPEYDTVERMLGAIGATFGELNNEQRMLLSAHDAAILHDAVPALRECVPLLERILTNDAKQKELGTPVIEPRPPRRRKPDPTRDGTAFVHEVQVVPNGEIPEWAYRLGARRAYRVLTDAMIGAGILEGAEIYVRISVDRNAADGQIIVCTLNGSTYLKRLDVRGGQTVLESANTHYPKLTVTDEDDFSMIGIVVA